tara:strand:- start:42 stop:794 length:753 start_codon:yes stop_codon:yes gene_type:complete
MAVKSFTPINFVDYSDDYGGLKTFQESFQNAKNLAVQAMENKRAEFMQDELDRLENDLFPPQGASMVVGDGSGGKRLNKGFYAIMNKTPEQAFRAARSRAERAGLGKHGINRREYMAAWKEMQQQGIKRQYQKLSEYGARHGTHTIQNILENEGGKFNAYYQRFTDPYIESLNLSVTSSPRKKNFTPLGWTLKTRNGVQKVDDIPLGQHLLPINWGLQNNEVFVENGVKGAYNVWGNFVPLGVDDPPKGP